MELRASGSCSVESFLEAVCPIDSEQSDHGEENSDADSGGAFHVEWVEFVDVRPGVTSFDESEGEDGGGCLEHEWVAQFEGHA